MTLSPAASPASLANGGRHTARDGGVRTFSLLACALSFAAQAFWFAASAQAQTPDAFAAALIRFATAVEGSFGDEGPNAHAALESMTRALTEWDARLGGLVGQTRSVEAPPATRAQLLVDLARQYMARGRTRDAIDALEALARIDSGRADEHLLRGRAYDAAGRPAEAGSAFHAAWNSNRANPVAAYWALQRSGGALTDADRQLALDSLAAISRGLTPASGSAPPFPVFGSGSVVDSETPVALPAAYAGAYERMTTGDYSEALAGFRKAAAVDPLLTDPARSLPAFSQGTAALRQGRPAIARDRFRDVVAAMPDSSEAHRLLGVAYWSNHEFEASVTELTAAIRLRPADERSRIMLARVLVERQEYSKAADVLRQTIEALPESSYAQMWLGSVYESLNRNADAASAYAAAIPRVISGRRRLYHTVGQLHEAIADVGGVIETLSRSVSFSPNDPVAHNRLARSYADQDRRNEAFAEYSAALLIDPASPEAHMGIGQLHLDADRPGDAAIVLRRLVSLQPASPEARYALANALLRSGQKADGNRELAEFQRLQAQHLEQSRRSMALGVIKEEATLRTSEREFERAITLWEQAIAREPAVASNHAGLAAALAGAGRLDAAAEQYEKAAALGGPAETFRQLAAIYDRLGRPEASAQAHARFEQALLAPARRAGSR